MPIGPSRSWYEDGGRDSCARIELTLHVKGAAEGLDPLPHACQAHRSRVAIASVARGKTLAIVGNDDPELIRPVGGEGHRGLPCPGVLANVGQGFLDEPEELERREW